MYYFLFLVRVTVHRNKFLYNKTNYDLFFCLGVKFLDIFQLNADYLNRH